MKAPQTRLTRLPPGFWARVASAPHRFLMLDYDGTLAPFRIERETALPLPAALRALRLLTAAPATDVVIVSGRPVRELRRLLGPLDVVIVGEHGWERWIGGRIEEHPLPAAALNALERAAQAAIDAELGDRLERKRTALVLHTRGLDAARAAETEEAARRIWEAPARSSGMRFSRIDGGLELRAALRDKGTVVREIASQMPAGTLVVYVGDDETDEDAFREVRGSGYGIRVAHYPRESLAGGTLASCEDVASLLEEWVNREARESGGAPGDG